MKVQFNCLYCNHFWDEYFYSIEQAEGTICPRCKDKNLKVKQADSGDYFGYEKKTTKDAYIKKK